MSFTDAIRSGFSHYATFSGRARRSEYWWWSLFVGILSIIPAIPLEMVSFEVALQKPVNVTLALVGGGLYALLFLGLFLPSLAVSVRRLHDTNRSGWWYLINFIPLVGGIVLLVFYCSDSKPAANAHGPSPKYQPPVLGDAAAAPAV